MITIDEVGMTSGNELQGPRTVEHLTLTTGPTTLRLSTLGAAIDDVVIAGTSAPPQSIVLSLDTVAERDDPTLNPYLGVTVGRFANRIGASRFEIDGRAHEVRANEGPNQLHGGPVGFGQVVWEAEATGTDEVTFRRVSPDGEMGFPGTLTAAVTYRLRPGVVQIELTATTDAPTVVSLTNHSYWNLGGPTEPDITDHLITIDAHLIVPIDDASLPVGEPIDVEGGPFDLRSPTRLGDRLGFALPGGFDHCFLPDGDGLRRHARIEHTGTGRTLEVWSDQPATQFYTGVFLAGGAGAHGRRHDPFAALCVEPQHVPDAPNLGWAPSAVLRPGERYVHRLELRFGEK